MQPQKTIKTTHLSITETNQAYRIYLESCRLSITEQEKNIVNVTKKGRKNLSYIDHNAVGVNKTKQYGHSFTLEGQYFSMSETLLRSTDQ